MKILALEFSSSRRSVAVLESGARGASGEGLREPGTGAMQILGCAAEAGAGGSKAFEMITAALSAAGLEREQVECLAVGLGPGSYTGIRVAIAIAQGWELASGLRLAGVSSVECMAAQLADEGFEGRAHVIVDAQRREFYLATFAFAGGGFREVRPLGLASEAEVRALHEAGEVLAGPEVERWFSGARRLDPQAGMTARLAGSRLEFTAGERLEPIYLRATSYVKAPPPRFGPASDGPVKDGG
jgi:tRNA threonylcarbamoyl adenosine modification protein YeaZ